MRFICWVLLLVLIYRISLYDSNFAQSGAIVVQMECCLRVAHSSGRPQTRMGSNYTSNWHQPSYYQGGNRLVNYTSANYNANRFGGNRIVNYTSTNWNANRFGVNRIANYTSGNYNAMRFGGNRMVNYASANYNTNKFGANIVNYTSGNYNANRFGVYYTGSYINQTGFGHHTVKGFSVTSGSACGGYGSQNNHKYQENVDFSLDYDHGDTNAGHSSAVVPYGKNNNDRYSQQNNRHSNRKFNNNFSNYRARPVQCFTCGATFPNKTALLAHRNKAHSKRTYYCPVCNKQFGVLKHMKEHERTHTIQACQECPEVFKFKASLLAHKEHAHPPRPTITELPATIDPPVVDPPAIEKSGFKSFTSPVAASTPATSFTETSQDSGVHIKSEAHSCPHCIKSFDSEEQLKSHSKIHTDPKLELSQPSKSSDKLSCPFCIKQFLTRREVTLHLNTAHTQILYCRKCPAEFSTQVDLDAHSKVHA